MSPEKNILVYLKLRDLYIFLCIRKLRSRHSAHNCLIQKPRLMLMLQVHMPIPGMQNSKKCCFFYVCDLHLHRGQILSVTSNKQSLHSLLRRIQSSKWLLLKTVWRHFKLLLSTVYWMDWSSLKVPTSVCVCGPYCPLCDPCCVCPFLCSSFSSLCCGCGKRTGGGGGSLCPFQLQQKYIVVIKEEYSKIITQLVIEKRIQTNSLKISPISGNLCELFHNTSLNIMMVRMVVLYLLSK